MELKASSSRTSVIITAKKMMMISLKVNISGLKTPLRAISIMPLEKVEPSSTPMLATTMMTLKLAIREPMAELRKLTASLLTPTNRSTAARMARNTSMSRKMLSTSRLLRNSLRMRHILCRQVLLQNGDGGGEMQRGEGLEGEWGRRVRYSPRVKRRSFRAVPDEDRHICRLAIACRWTMARS